MIKRFKPKINSKILRIDSKNEVFDIIENRTFNEIEEEKLSFTIEYCKLNTKLDNLKINKSKLVKDASDNIKTINSLKEEKTIIDKEIRIYKEKEKLKIERETYAINQLNDYFTRIACETFLDKLIENKEKLTTKKEDKNKKLSTI